MNYFLNAVQYVCLIISGFGIIIFPIYAAILVKIREGYFWVSTEKNTNTELTKRLYKIEKKLSRISVFCAGVVATIQFIIILWRLFHV